MSTLTTLSPYSHHNIIYNFPTVASTREDFLAKPTALAPLNLAPIDVILENDGNYCWLNSALIFAAKTGILDFLFPIDINLLIEKKVTLRKKNLQYNIDARKKELQEILENCKTWLCDNPNFEHLEKTNLDRLVFWCRALDLKDLSLKFKEWEDNKQSNPSYEEVFNKVFSIDFDELFSNKEAEEKAKCKAFIQELEDKRESLESLHSYLFAAIDYLRTEHTANTESIELLKGCLSTYFFACFSDEANQNKQFDTWEFFSRIITLFGEDTLETFTPDVLQDADIFKGYERKGSQKQLETLLIQIERHSPEGFINTQLTINERIRIPCQNTERAGLPSETIEYDISAAIVYFSENLENFETCGHYVCVVKCIKDEVEQFLLYNDSEIILLTRNEYLGYIRAANILFCKRINQASLPLILTAHQPLTDIRIGSIIRENTWALFQDWIADEELHLFMKPKKMTPHSSFGVRLMVPPHDSPSVNLIGSTLIFAAASGVLDFIHADYQIKNEKLAIIHHLILAAIQLLRQPPDLSRAQTYTCDEMNIIFVLLLQSLSSYDKSFLNKIEHDSVSDLIVKFANLFGSAGNPNLFSICSETSGKNPFSTILFKNPPKSLYLHVYSQYGYQPLQLTNNDSINISGLSYKIQSMVVNVPKTEQRQIVIERSPIPGLGNQISHSLDGIREVRKESFDNYAKVASLLHLEKK
jgi:hypothetical protein